MMEFGQARRNSISRRFKFHIAAVVLDAEWTLRSHDRCYQSKKRLLTRNGVKVRISDVCRHVSPCFRMIAAYVLVSTAGIRWRGIQLWRFPLYCFPVGNDIDLGRVTTFKLHQHFFLDFFLVFFSQKKKKLDIVR